MADEARDSTTSFLKTAHLCDPALESPSVLSKSQTNLNGKNVKICAGPTVDCVKKNKYTHTRYAEIKLRVEREVRTSDCWADGRGVGARRRN